jgi:hypothetical protein
MLTTATGKPRVSGFHCRQLQKDCYKTLKAFMALTGAITEEFNRRQVVRGRV